MREREPRPEPQTFPDRMDGVAQARRSDGFRAATQGPGKPMIYGTGKVPEAKPAAKSRRKAAKS